MTTAPARRGFAAAVAVALALFGARDSRGAGLDVVPALSLDTVWDSNVFNSTMDERSDFLVRARPSLTLAVRAAGTTFDLQGTMTAEKYLKYHELDGLEASKGVTLYPADPIRLSPSLHIRPTAYFVEETDFRSRLFSAPVPGEPVGVPLEGVDLTVVSGQSTVREYSGAVTVHYAPAPRVESDVRLSALRQELLDVPTSDRDFNVYAARGVVYYQVLPRLQLGPHVRYSRTDYETGLRVQVYEASLAARSVIRDGQVLEVRGGASRSRQNTEPAVNTTSPYGYVSLDSTWAALHTVVSGEYGLEEGGVIRGSAKRFLGRLLVEKGLSARTTGELTGAYQRSWWTEPAAREAVSIYSASLTLRYLAYTWASVRLGGTYFWQRSDLAEAHDLRRGAAFLGVDLTSRLAVF